ncbi:hypothetical protein [Winogradskyella sp.]|uniref:hypothetical protein n=1 Tax=Winogradskyella sp. TaxID=1883156 RepID=UPI003F6B7D5A
MKNLLRSTVILVATSLMLLFGCTAEEEPIPCACEEVFYLEQKYQPEGDDTWLLERIETSRNAVPCQDETDFVRTGNGTEVSRIECDD